jgi:glycerophosphoryl diester phosphodiesterase
MAHRGGPRYATENTIELFSHSEKLTDCFEMDVCETADKILVVHHDHHLSRTCGVDRDIEEYNYVDLPQFMAEIVLDFAVKLTTKSKK